MEKGVSQSQDVYQLYHRPVPTIEELEQGDRIGFSERMEQGREERVVAPFAFDLRREYELAQLHGDVYKQFFIEQAHYYAKETYGQVPVSEYEHGIKRDANGKVELTFGPQDQNARASYLEPVLDRTKPEWYRRRSMADVNWTDGIQEELEFAEPGDTFIDVSPTEFDISAPERKKWGFGHHSFVRIHKYVIEAGEEKLVSRAVRNYLDLPEQHDLFIRLTGEDIDAGALLGSVGRVDSNLTPAHVQRLAKEAYDATPEDRKIKPEDDSLWTSVKGLKTEEEMDEFFPTVNLWLEDIFNRMRRGESPDVITKKFHGWENFVKDFCNGKFAIDEIPQIRDIRTPEEFMFFARDVVETYEEKEYEAGYNGCGLGSGFGEEGGNSGTRVQGKMDYESMTIESCPEIKCGRTGCSWKASESEANKIQKGELKNCPKCKWKPGESKEPVDLEKYRKDKEKAQGDQKKAA